MFETIAFGLISTCINFIFDTAILRTSTIEIDGSPNWYEKQGEPKAFYVSSFCDGDIDAVDCAKEGAKKEIVIIIEDAFDQAVEKSFQNYQGKERSFIEKMQKDKDLPLFVKRNIKFQNLKYDKELQRAFARGYITYAALEEYEKDRIGKVKMEVLDYHYDEMMEELDDEMMEELDKAS